MSSFNISKIAVARIVWENNSKHFNKRTSAEATEQCLNRVCVK